MSAALLSVRGLQVEYRAGEPVLREVDFELAAGECLAVLGESGSGKSTIARAVMGLLPKGTCHAGKLRFDGAPLDATPPAVLGRGRRFFEACSHLTEILPS